MDLNCDESQQKDSRNHEKSDNSTIIPGIFRAAPLEGQQKANDSGEEKETAERIQLAQQFA